MEGPNTRELQTELDLFKSLVKAIYATLNMNQLLSLIIDMMISAVSAEVGIILLRDGEKFVPRAQLGLGESILTAIKAGDSTLLEWLTKKKRTVIIRDVQTDPKIKEPKSEVMNIHSVISTPLILHNEVIGIIILANRISETPNPFFTARDAELLTSITSQVTVVIENARLYEEVINLKNYNESILENIPSGVITTDLSGVVITMNKGAEFILGLSSEQVIGGKISAIFKRVTFDQFDIMKIIQSGENLINYEVTLQKDNGEMVILGVSVSVLKNDKNRIMGSLINIMDFTERKLIENQMHRTEQLAALGEMSAGLAHEIKNPLTSIRGFTQLLPQKNQEPGFIKKYIEIVTRESNRLNEIVERFLSFARPKAPGFQSCDINDVLLNTLSLLHYQLEKQKIEIRKKFLEVPTVHGDWQQLEQVFLNVILNAAQMMDKSEKILTIQTSTHIKKMMDNRYKEFALVRITDNGPGIPKSLLDKIFNPFYTTRQHGTGLGLSITNRIVEEHSGFIEVTSEEGIGSTFAIFLPTIEK
jgi:PAS domain S-box-containing protein